MQMTFPPSIQFQKIYFSLSRTSFYRPIFNGLETLAALPSEKHTERPGQFSSPSLMVWFHANSFWLNFQYFLRRSRWPPSKPLQQTRAPMKYCCRDWATAPSWLLYSDLQPSVRLWFDLLFFMAQAGGLVLFFRDICSSLLERATCYGILTLNNNDCFMRSSGAFSK